MDVCSLAEVKGSGVGVGVRWDGGEGTHIAEPVPERYRFTLATIPALLVKAEPRGGGIEWEGGHEGEGGVTYL